MKRWNVWRSTCFLVCATALSFATHSDVFASPYAGVPAPAAPTADIIYTSDGNDCAGERYGVGGGAGRDLVTPAATGNSAVALRLPAHRKIVGNVLFSPDGRIIATSDGEGVRLSDAASGRTIRVIIHNDGLSSPAFTSDGKRMVGILGTEVVALFDVATGRELQAFYVPAAVALPGDAEAAVAAVAVSPDGRWIAAARGTVAYVWEAANSDRLTAFMAEATVDEGVEQYAWGHTEPITQLRFSPNGKALLSVGESVRLWDMATGAFLRCFDYQGIGKLSVAEFSSDGRLVVATRDEVVQVWNALTSEQALEIRGAFWSPFTSASFSRDGKKLLTTEVNNNALIRDARSGELLGIMRHPGAVYSAAFSPDGRRVVTGWDDQAWVWDAGHKNLTLAVRALEAEGDANELAQQGDYAGAAAMFRRAASLNPDRGYAVPDAWSINGFCWHGALDGQGKLVLPFCDRAIADSPLEIMLFDSRGLARALTGDRNGAISDFQHYVDHWTDLSGTDPDYRPQRRAWIAALKAGRNPFDEATLRELRGG